MHWEIYIISLLISISIYGLIAKRFVQTFLDPLLINIIFISLANTVVLFLFILSQISLENFINFVLAQLLFWIGFRLLYKRHIHFSEITIRRDEDNYFFKTLFVISLLVNIISVLLTYFFAGLPILAESRLDTYTGGSGFGMLSRLVAFTTIVNVYSLFYFWKKTKKKSLNRFLLILFLLFSVVTSILSGSKGAFMIYIFIFFCYKMSSSTYIYDFKFLSNKLARKLFIVGLAIVLLVIVIQSKESLNYQQVGFKFVERLVSSGDTYWMAYPNNAYRIIDNSKPFQSLFQDVLGSFRLVPWTSFPKHPGLTLNWYHHPELDGQNTGPTARFEVLSYAYWGWGNLIFSFSLGLIVSWIMYRLPRILPNSNISKIIWTYCYINVLGFVGDPILAISSFNNLTFAFVLLMIPALFLSLYLLSFKKMRNNQGLLI